MATAQAVPALSNDDPLDYLPRVPVIHFRKGQCIYGQDENHDFLYMVNDGFVKISNIGRDGREVLIDIYRAEEFFGKLSFHPSTAASTECAFALSEVHVMCWPIEDIYALMLNRPQLALAFLKIQAARNMTSVARIESTATMDLKDRLAGLLLYLNGRLGDIPLTHSLLSQYLGSSRELVTCQMVKFRREKLIQYSRQGLKIDAAKLAGRLRR